MPIWDKQKKRNVRQILQLDITKKLKIITSQRTSYVQRGIQTNTNTVSSENIMCNMRLISIYQK